MAELPSGTVTFLFTDLEGSTRLWEDHADAMQGALARHDELLRDAISAHDGHIVKTNGDRFHAAFATAHDAIGAALAGQCALCAESWDVPGPLWVRMGVHTGEAQHRDGDYYGTALNRAARLMSAAHGGQVLVSDISASLVADALPNDVSLLELGEYRLRDVGTRLTIFQIVHSALRTEFPPLRSVEEHPSNLPGPTNSFVGRAGELDSVIRALQTSRLVTLVGVGGVGKTRLALEAAAEALPRFTDGAWLCELAAAGDPDAMVQVLASDMGVMPRAGMSLGDSVVDYLRSKRLLLVLDNCEHLLDAAAAIATAVLRNCAQVTVLATSREALAIPGEQVWPVRPLSIEDNTAVQLFVERAHSAWPDFVFDEANRTAVVDICRCLDGIPLAIELAAARVSSMAPADIVTRLDERFRLLTGSRRGTVERHQTLRSAVDWSYSLLDDVTRTVFVRLGVFAGSFDARAAEEIVSGDGLLAWDVVDALRELVGKSLVSVDHSVPNRTRYQMLETLRAYARERLDEAGQTDRWCRRHATYYASLAEEAGPMMFGADWLAWLPHLRADLDEFRASVTWSLESGTDDDGELAVRIAAALANLASDDRSNGIHVWAERSVARAERSTPGRRMAILGAASMTAWSSGDLDETRRLADAALCNGLAKDCPAPMWPYATLALTQVLSGESESALATLTQADEAFRDVGVHDWHLARLFQVRSYVEAMLGMPTAAERARESLRIGRELRSVTLLNGGLFNVAYTSWRDDPQDAMAALEESIALSHAGAVFVAYGDALGLLAQLQAQAQDPRALDTMRAAVVEGSDIGSRISLATSLDRAVIALHSLGRNQLAAELAGSVTTGALEPLTVLPFPEHAAREETIRTVRDELGPEQYDQAAARGAAMSYDELVAHVVTELDREIETRDG